MHIRGVATPMISANKTYHHHHHHHIYIYIYIYSSGLTVRRSVRALVSVYRYFI